MVRSTRTRRRRSVGTGPRQWSPSQHADWRDQVANVLIHATERAIAILEVALRPLGVEPTLETREIDEGSFAVNPSESNRIWILGKPMEEWLGGSVGSSRCCSVCGESECRTVEVSGTMFEVIPEKLLLRARLDCRLSIAGRRGVARCVEMARAGAWAIVLLSRLEMVEAAAAVGALTQGAGCARRLGSG